ncbi:MAG: coproporphyrinogen-III oxidase family protein [Phycisphaerae bacterium]
MVELPQIAGDEADSHFVANYPPFSVWRPEHLPAAIEALDSEPRPDVPLGLYLHIPFCRKRCRFCYYRVYTDRNAADVEVYLDALAREVAMYADRPALRGRQFEFVYFGGGTPSFLSSKQLRRLIDRINRTWTWDAAREVTFECEPGTLRKSKLEAIRAIGVTRLSLGVEHFDDAILEVNGRAHKSPEIFRAYGWAREVGFPQINLDLIAGMVGETDDKWARTVEESLALEPDSVTIYQMELPHNSVLSRECRASGTAPPIADWATKRRWVDEAFRRFEAAGYVVSSAYTLVKSSIDSDFVYRDALWHGADLIGTGVASFSHFAGVHFQNVDGWEDYVQSCRAGRLPLHRALPITPRQALIRELSLQLKTGRLDAGYFRHKFGAEIRREFAEVFESLTAEAHAVIDGDEIRLTRPGLLQADALLTRFFENAHRNIRYT